MTLLPPAPLPPAALPLLAVRAPTGRHRVSLRAARAFCEALFSEDDQTPCRADRMDWLMGELDDLITRASWRPSSVYKLLLLLINFLAPLTIGIPLPLWSLTVEERVRALRKLERSPAAAVVLATKAIICIVYYEHPEVALEAGYTGGCSGVAA